MASVEKGTAVREQVRRLRELLPGGPGARRRELASYAAECVSTGCEALDELLPRGGWSRGSLVEWLGDVPGSGAGVLALAAARELHGQGGAVVVVDRSGMFYPPAAAAWRLDLASVIVVHPESEKDEQWAIDQALRCEHTTAVLAWPRRLDDRTFRRLQLAAEASGAVGLLVRPVAAEREPSWADVRLAVAPFCAARCDLVGEARGEESCGRGSGARVRRGPTLASRVCPRPGSLLNGWQLCVRLVHCRGRFGKQEGEVVVEIDERTGEIHAARAGDLASELAPSATAQ